VVYRARNESTGRDVALKVLRPEATSSRESLARFQRDVKALDRLRHPNIVRLLDSNRANEPPFFAMELLPGPNLADYIRQNGRLTIPDAAGLALPVLAALGFAHRRGIVHRDLKPANIVLGSRGQPVLTDFGIALLSDATRLTEAMSTLGTPLYMSPEQAEGGTAIVASDLYSVGVILYEMLTGRVPFYDDNIVVLLDMHIHQTPVPPRSLVPDLPAELERVVLKALAKNPSQRHASAEQMSAELNAAVDGVVSDRRRPRIPRVPTEPVRVSQPVEPYVDDPDREQAKRLVIVAMALTVVLFFLLLALLDTGSGGGGW